MGKIEPPVQPQLARGAQDALFLVGIDAAAVIDDPVHGGRRQPGQPRNIAQGRLSGQWRLLSSDPA